MRGSRVVWVGFFVAFFARNAMGNLDAKAFLRDDQPLFAPVVRYEVTSEAEVVYIGSTTCMVFPGTLLEEIAQDQEGHILAKIVRVGRAEEQVRQGEACPQGGLLIFSLE